MKEERWRDWYCWGGLELEVALESTVTVFLPALPLAAASPELLTIAVPLNPNVPVPLPVPLVSRFSPDAPALAFTTTGGLNGCFSRISLDETTLATTPDGRSLHKKCDPGTTIFVKSTERSVGSEGFKFCEIRS